MKLSRIFAVIAVIAIAIAIAAWPAAALALWVGDDAVETGAHTFECSGNGKLEVRFFDAEGLQMYFYEFGGEFFVDDASLKDEYLENGMADAGDCLLVYEHSEVMNVMYDIEMFGYFEMTAIPEDGFVLERFVDSSCGCLLYLEHTDAVYRVTMDSVDTLGAIFSEDPDWVNVSPTLNMKLNGEPIVTDVAPFILDDRTMVPVRFIGEVLGARADWEQESKTVTVTAADGMVIKLISGDTHMLIVRDYDISVITMDVATVIRDGRAFVPVRYIAEALGLTISWNGQTKTVAFFI